MGASAKNPIWRDFVVEGLEKLAIFAHDALHFWEARLRFRRCMDGHPCAVSSSLILAASSSARRWLPWAALSGPADRYPGVGDLRTRAPLRAGALFLRRTRIGVPFRLRVGNETPAAQICVRESVPLMPV